MISTPRLLQLVVDLQLKKLLFEEDPDASSHLDEVLNGSDFTVFIRSIIGLEAQAAKALFAEFINRPYVTAEQMVFINALIDFLTKKRNH